MTLLPRLLQAADAAGRAREGWVQVAHALDRITAGAPRIPLTICG